MDPTGEVAIVAIPLIVGAVGAGVTTWAVWDALQNTKDGVNDWWNDLGNNVCYAKKSKSSDRTRATDIPSWAKGTKPKPGQSGKDYANEQMNMKYPNEWSRKGQQGKEHSQLKKWGDRYAK